jgi:hypothetical protein
MNALRASLPIVFLLGGCPEDDPGVSVLPDLGADQGLSIRIPEFEVAEGAEIQDCYFFAMPEVNGAAQDIWVNRIVTAINPGSHHMNVFRVNTIVNLDPTVGSDVQIGTFDGTPIMAKFQHGESPATDECFRSPNWADWPLVANSQNSDPNDPLTDWTLPEGVAHKFVPGEMLMLQVHYVNAGTQSTPTVGKVGVNLHKAPTSTSQIELGTLFATQQSISVCQSEPQVEFHGTCRFPAGTLTIAAANGHFHSRGTNFDIYTWDGVTTTPPDDGSRFYTSTSWDDPPMARDLEVQPPSGGGIWWTCQYRWQEPEAPRSCADVDARDPQMRNDCCYTFGPVVETSEHCNVFAYYWPKVDRSDIFCN